MAEPLVSGSSHLEVAITTGNLEKHKWPESD
jgi:hypothetical protein